MTVSKTLLLGPAMPNKFKGTVKTTINAEYKSTVNCCLANVSPLYLANKFENGDFALAIIGSFIIGFISVIFSYKYTEINLQSVVFSPVNLINKELYYENVVILLLEIRL